MLNIIHLLAAMLAVWRITELFTQDRITTRLRIKYPTYLWQCPRCMSIWAGAAATAIFYFWPWANWPFAFGWLYLAHLEGEVTKRITQKGRQLILRQVPTGISVEQSDFSPQELPSIGQMLVNMETKS